MTPIQKVKETSDIREAARLLDDGWRILAAAGNGSMVKLSLGYSGPAEPDRNEKDSHSEGKEAVAKRAIDLLLHQMEEEDKTFKWYCERAQETGPSRLDKVWRHCRIVNDLAHTIAELLR